MNRKKQGQEARAIVFFVSGCGDPLDRAIHPGLSTAYPPLSLGRTWIRFPVKLGKQTGAFFFGPFLVWAFVFVRPLIPNSEFDYLLTEVMMK